MRFERVTVTPEMAVDWLGMNRGNRPLSRSTVQMYAADMAAGRWKLTSEAISFGEDGRLDNGQHRLNAVVTAGVPIEFTVAYDAPKFQFEVIDQGYKRSTGQILALEGARNGNTIAGAARAVLRYRKYPDRVWSGPQSGVTPSETLAYASEHDWDTSNLAAIRVLRFMPPAAWVAFAHIISEDAPSSDAWPTFIEGAIGGVGLSVGDPRLALRNLRTGNGGRRLAWGQGQSDILAGLTAWNHWLNGKEVKFIRAARGSLPMPKPL